MNISRLFVYGSLLSGFKSPAYEYISRYFILEGEARVKGKLFDMGSYPAAVPAEEDAFIKGELYAIRNPAELSWAIGQLDDYEGVSPEAGEPQLYRREAVEALADGRPVMAWIYWYNGSIEGRPLIASGSILEYIKNAEKNGSRE